MVDENVRRKPQQERSRRSVDAILDATATLVLATDPGSITMSAIGEQAGVSKAAIYRYYPDRPAVIQALASRELEKLDLPIDLGSRPGSPSEAAEQFGEAVDVYYRCFLDNPVLRAIWITGYSVPDVGELGLSFDSMVAERLAERFVNSIDGSTDSVLRRLQIVIHLLRSAVELAVHDGPDRGDEVISEIKDVLSCGLFGALPVGAAV